MKNLFQDALIFTVVVLGFTAFKIVNGVKKLFKPKIYICSKCKMPIVRGSAIRIGSKSICLNCFTRGR